MRKFSLLVIFSLLFGCAEKEWTEGVSIGGFKRGLSTQVKYKMGGETTFNVKLESEIYNKLKYPITLTVYLNNEVCDISTINKPNSSIIVSAECSGTLGKGMHTYEAKVTSINGMQYITEEDDLQYNRIEGSITYTIESGI